jgi:Erv1 / Alr family
MPCACKAPLDKYPETADWGPIMWRVLHGLAERAGRQPTAILQQDEIRLWIQLISSLKQTIPCDICADHYGRWLADHPPSVLSTMAYKDTATWIQHYFWELHTEINEGNEKPVFRFEDLRAFYKDVNLTESWKALEPVMKRAIQLNGISLLPWRKWLGFVRMLQGLYG